MSTSTTGDLMPDGSTKTNRGMIPLEYVLCQYVAKARWTVEPYYGAVVIQVARAADIWQEFDLVMWQQQRKPYPPVRLVSWRLTSYLPESGRPNF